MQEELSGGVLHWEYLKTKYAERDLFSELPGCNTNPPQAWGLAAALQQGVVVCLLLICFLPKYRFASLGLLQAPTTFGIVSLHWSLVSQHHRKKFQLSRLMFQSSQLMDPGPCSLPLVF